jgi:endonuclease-8
MPEGDTIARAATALHRALAGRVVTAFTTGLASLARVDDDTPIAGRTIDGCRSVGKHLLMVFSGGLVLRTHMRMHGSWHLYRPGERWQRSPRAARIRSTPMPGWPWPSTCRWPSSSAKPTCHVIARWPCWDPDLADPAYDRADAVARIGASGHRAVGEMLLDQRVVAGIGNVLRSETLFVAGLHPETPAALLSAGDVTRLLDTAAALVQRNARADAYPTRNTTGRRAPGDALWVYQRTGRPCRRCGTVIRSAVPGLDARRVYWCPACQPKATETPGLNRKPVCASPSRYSLWHAPHVLPPNSFAAACAAI